MNKQQAIEVLKAHNKWRRDKGDTRNLTMHEPKVIGEAIDVAIAALSDESVTLPDGWVAVPVEPTIEMKTKGAESLDIKPSEATKVYKAMLQAAPTIEADSGEAVPFGYLCESPDKVARIFVDKPLKIKNHVNIPLFTSTQKQWVELTDEQLDEIREEARDVLVDNETLRLVEAKLKEVNHG